MSAKCFFISVVIHVALLFGSALWLYDQAEFGVSSGLNSVEVDLVAAPEATPPPSTPMPETNPEPVPSPDPEPMAKIEETITTPQESPKPIAPTPPKPQIIAKTGDGSSPLPGNDATTLHSEKGSESISKASYLKNPPPPYPETARRKKVEGSVLLSVVVSETGEATSVTILKSSGHADLDNSARRTIAKWKFKPASRAGIPIVSQVEIPVVFDLENQNG